MYIFLHYSLRQTEYKKLIEFEDLVWYGWSSYRGNNTFYATGDAINKVKKVLSNDFRIIRYFRK